MPTVPRKKWLEPFAKKRARIMALRQKDKTLEQIATLMGLSRQRIAQIIAAEKARAERSPTGK